MDSSPPGSILNIPNQSCFSEHRFCIRNDTNTADVYGVCRLPRLTGPQPSSIPPSPAP